MRFEIGNCFSVALIFENSIAVGFSQRISVSEFLRALAQHAPDVPVSCELNVAASLLNCRWLLVKCSMISPRRRCGKVRLVRLHRTDIHKIPATRSSASGYCLFAASRLGISRCPITPNRFRKILGTQLIGMVYRSDDVIILEKCLKTNQKTPF